MNINIGELDQVAITSNSAVLDFIKTKPGTLNKKMSDRNLDWFPPILLFHEQIDAARIRTSNGLTVDTLYGGGESKALHRISSMDRHLLSAMRFKQGSDDTVDDTKRGEILAAFTKIEFCLDALVCIELGLMDDKISLSDMHKELMSETQGIFNSVQKKIIFLKHRKVITKNTYKLLEKTKKIRNNLAHQYLPSGNYGVSDKDITRYQTRLVSIFSIYNACWYHLLCDYSPHQLKILDWLNAYFDLNSTEVPKLIH